MSSSDWWDKYDRLWDFLSISCLVASLCILINVSNRLLNGEPDIVGNIVVILQTSLTPFIIGGFITKTGKKYVDMFMKWLGIPIRFKQEGRLIIAFAFLIILIIFQNLMPVIGNTYHNIGHQSYKTREFNKAQKNFKRAINFSPDEPLFRHNLALLYEELNDLELAQKEYKLSAGTGYLKSVSNLSRLYILKGETKKATHILLKSIQEKKFNGDWGEVPIEIKYGLEKNLGWARLLQERYSDAYNHLKNAIDIKEKNCKAAAAHCLLAITKEETGHNSDALVEWGKCMAFSEPITPEIDQWVWIAQQRINTDNSKWAMKECENE